MITNVQYIKYYTRKIILGIYAFLLFDFGVLKVPWLVIWGVEKRIDSAYWMIRTKSRKLPKVKYLADGDMNNYPGHDCSHNRTCHE